ncbi:MAG: ERAP1-like C-terminal domain-containing protein, partial [Bacteroidetes bacterium]|nr:ERAP1-like C-terminal domain-containing protein [Bacteroidota bacterium]
QAEDGSDRLWPQYFEVLLVYPDRVKEVTVHMDQQEISLMEVAGSAAPDFVLFNSSGQGYGVFPVDEQMMPSLFDLENPVARASAYISLFENMLNSRSISPRQLVDLYRSGLSQEPEELNLKLMTDQLSNIFWKFLPAAERTELAATLESELWAAMQQQADQNAKKHLFKAYQSIAMTSETQDRLYGLWEKEEAPTGVKLTEDDYTSLALALAVRDYPANTPILPTQIERIKNPDRKKRLQFMIPALSADVRVRDAFFASLKDPENREKEAWVSTALGYLHHPLRQGSSRNYLRKSLELLEEIQQTGDIFFPYAWLQATFGLYNSPAEAKIVRDFLARHPDYNPKLRAKILQAADDLFRAEKLLKTQN